MLLLDTPIKIPFFADVKNFENFRIRKSRRNRPFLNCQNICNFSFDLYSNASVPSVYIFVYIFKDPSNTISAISSQKFQNLEKI